MQEETRKKALSCISMLEKYYDKVAALDGNGTVSLVPADKKAWLEDYYPSLVLNGPKIPDDCFFYPDGNHPDFGIGNDAIMGKYDYCNFMYRCYALIVDLSPARLQKMSVVGDLAKVAVLDCFIMVDKYVAQLVGNPFAPSLRFSEKDMKIWKENFYPMLVASGRIPDGRFFGAENASNMGIGSDGVFTGCELLHFLYECEKYLNQ